VVPGWESGIKPAAAKGQLVDPRQGDVEDDRSSTTERSLLAIAGSLLTEISLPKLLFAWSFSIVLPSVLLGLAPLVATAWLAGISGSFARLTGIGTMLVLVAVAGLGWIGWRPLLRVAEINFWSLNALAIQPGYAFCRETWRYLAERTFGRRGVAERAGLRSASSIGAAFIVCAFGLAIAVLAWPASRWIGSVQDLLSLQRLILPTLANAVVLVSAYMALACLVWGLADASMDQPLDLTAFDSPSSGAHTWRIAHVSDLHVVGERYGFRIECGRNGPRGNGRLERIMDCLEALHAQKPIHLILVSGDMTDAGRSTEWAEFLDVLSRHPSLAERMIAVPGNHDVNIVDRANPARLDLPFSPGKRLRQIRALSSMATVQGDRVRIVDPMSRRLAQTLSEAMASNSQRIQDFGSSTFQVESAEG
jgi:hypothetical protein